MAPAEYNASFSGAYNYGLQAGYIANVHYYPAERPETPPGPSLSIPFLRDPDFVDCATILNQLHNRRAEPGSRAALVGLGGVGKSQLAIEYAYQIHEREPETWIFWIYASNADRLEQSYRELADTVKLFGRRDPKANIFKLVHDWLRDSKNGKWIIILDNVDDAHFLIKQPAKLQDQAQYEIARVDRPLWEYLPRTPNGWLLITSRSKEAALKLVDQRDIIVVDPMDEAHAQALFEKKLGKQNTCEDIAMLATVLEYIPLAIVQAAAYISDPDRGCSVRQYLSEFQKSDREKIYLLDHEESQFRRDWEAKNSILMTWQISFDSIRQHRPSAADLLSLISFFDRQGIPKALLRNRSERGTVETHSNDDDSESQFSVTDEFNNDILVLQRYSLISINVDRMTFSMHNLVQLATRQWLEANGELERWKRQFIYNLNAGFPVGEYEDWAQCQALFPHVKAAAAQEPQGRESLLQWASVLYRATQYVLAKGNGGQGKQLSVKAMKARKELLGPEHEETLSSAELMGLVCLAEGQLKQAEEQIVQVLERRVQSAQFHDTLNTMANLAYIYWNQGRWKEAEAVSILVMKANKRVLGDEHPNTLYSIHNLASIYSDQGRWEEAEKLQMQVVEQGQTVLPTDPPFTLTSIANLALTYIKQGRWKEAEKLQLQAIEPSQRMLGIEHPTTLNIMANLAITYLNQGQWRKAEELGVQALKIRQRMLGVEHALTLTSMDNLASTYRTQGRWKEAEELHLQVMETNKRVLGAKHPNTLYSTNNLALLYSIQGRWEDAEKLLTQVIEQGQTVLGIEHPLTLTAMTNLAERYNKQGRWKEAEELGVQVLKIRQRVQGVEHPDALISMNNLAMMYDSQGRWKEAEVLEVQAMEAYKRTLGAEHPFTLAVMGNLVSIYANKAQWKEAEELAVQALEAHKRVLGAEHPDMLTIIASLSSIYREQGRWKEAEELGVQALEAHKRVLGAEHPDTLTIIASLSSIYREQGRWKEAEELGVQALEACKRVLGAEHPDTLTIIAILSSIYKKQGRWKEAEELGVQALEACKRVLGAEHPDTLTIIASLSSIYRDQGRWKEAEELGVQALEMRKKMLGLEHPDTLTSMNNLAFTWKEQGRGVEALDLLLDCVQLQSKVLGVKHIDTVSSSATLISWQAEKLDIKEPAANGVV